ncbi:sigma-54 interaction domain-containing protein [Desulfocastanea catecholica]
MYNILIFGLKEKREKLLADFSSMPCRFLHVNSSAEFYSTAFSRIFDVWIIEAGHPDFAELALAELAATHNTPQIFLIGGGDAKAEELVRSHANKVQVLADTAIGRCAELFAKLMRDIREQNRERYLAGYIQAQPGREAIVTKSPLMEKLLDLIKDIAPTESPIFLQGETGTGKELLANIFHNESRRRSGPFMAVNCGALPDSLLESELFGYEKGAFTGATSRRIGKIEHAAGGTLFLDEIESMSPAMQVRLLRVLQEKSLQRLGGNTEVSTDFRVIGATNTDPVELLTSGRLRSDLYYRLSVFQIHVPPLRDRIEDIPLLTQHLINKKKKDGRDYIKGLDRQAKKILLSVPWFGNIRELQNVIERAVMLADSEIISADLIHIPGLPIAPSHPSEGELHEHAFRPGTTLKSYKTFLSQAAERKYLVELLDYTNGRIGESAQFAGLTPRALYNKMKIYGLKKEDFRKSE